MAQSGERGREVYIDFLRIIAVYMVLFNHTGNRGFSLFTVNQSTPLFLFYLFNSIFIKIAVPLFIMTSGALLLGKEETLKHLIVHRFLKYLVVLIVCSAIEYPYMCHIHNRTMSISEFFVILYTSRMTVAYWYLYAYLAYILMLPLLRRLARAMTDRDYLWMFLLHGFINLLSIVDFLIWKGKKSHNSYFTLFIKSSFVFYPLMGYYIARKMKGELFNRKTILLLSACSVASILLCCFMTQYRCALIGEWNAETCQTFFKTLIFLPAITVFVAAKQWFSTHEPGERVRKLIEALGGTTFGIYLFENILRGETMRVFSFLKPYIKTLPACWVWILVACLLGAAATSLLKRIPGVNRFI